MDAQPLIDDLETRLIKSNLTQVQQDAIKVFLKDIGEAVTTQINKAIPIVTVNGTPIQGTIK